MEEEKTKYITNTRWVVTREINQYDQDGEYFFCVFDDKPTFAELKIILPSMDDKTIGKLTRGGGRQKDEYEWYRLTEVSVATACV